MLDHNRGFVLFVARATYWHSVQRIEAMHDFRSTGTLLILLGDILQRSWENQTLRVTNVTRFMSQYTRHPDS